MNHDSSASLTHWIWVWANFLRQWRSGSLAWCSLWHHKETDTTYDWTTASNNVFLRKLFYRCSVILNTVSSKCFWKINFKLCHHQRNIFLLLLHNFKWSWSMILTNKKLQELQLIWILTKMLGKTCSICLDIYHLYPPSLKRQKIHQCSRNAKYAVHSCSKTRSFSS